MLSCFCMDLPCFPLFRHISFEDKEWYEKFYVQFDPCADLSFGNLIVWLDQRGDLELSQINGNVVFRFSDIFSVATKEDQIYTLLGNKDLGRSAHQIFTYLQQQDLKPQLDMLPQSVADAISNDKNIRLETDLDNSDYVLDATAIAHLKGSKLRSLREDCNSFMR